MKSIVRKEKTIMFNYNRQKYLVTSTYTSVALH